MTVAIVIPFKAKQVSKSWDVTQESLRNTLNSIVNQSDKDYKVMIVGHDRPEFLDDYESKDIIFREAEFAAPDKASESFCHQNLIDDKVLKIISGLYYLRNENISYIYQLDSDDLIHKDFIKTLKNYWNYDAIIFQGGYMYYKSSKRIIETDQLDQYCGSVVVARKDSFEMPQSIDLNLKHDIPWTKYKHMKIFLYFERDTNQKVARNQDKLITYVLANGDNFSDRWRDSWIKRIRWKLKPYLKGTKVTSNYEELFGLSPKSL